MICPKCHREMGDELSCSECGFAFLLPKKDEESSEFEIVPADIENISTEEPSVEDALPESISFSGDSNPYRDILSSDPVFTYIPEEEVEEVKNPEPEHEAVRSETPEPEALKRSPVKATHVTVPVKKEVRDSISVGGYIGMLIVAFIPFISLIMCIIWACEANKRPNRAHFAVAVLVLKAISLLFVLGGIVAYLLISAQWILYWFS